MKDFLQKHAKDVTGVLSGFDRLLFRGTIRMLSAPQGMRSYLWHQQVLLKDFGNHVLKVSTRLKDAVTKAVEDAGRPVILLRSSNERKDLLARQIAERDGVKEGPVCLLKALEPCSSFEVRPNRATKRLEIQRGFRKCLFLYRYEIHPTLGFIHARIQSWFPFSVQVWINGREWLARQMDRAGLGYQRRDNCFVWLESPQRAQKLMDQQLRVSWAKLLDQVLDRLNPIRRTMFGNLKEIQLPYYWSVAQSEWATDILFRSPDALAGLYPRLVRHAITSFGSPDVMRFLGQKLLADERIHPSFRGQVVSNLNHRPEGICVKHRINRNGIKVYDKQGSVLRIETTIHQPYDFKIFRAKEGDSAGKRAWRPLRHGIADLHRRCEISQAANQRYGTALNAISDAASLAELTRRICQPTALGGRRVRSLRPWAPDELALLSAVGADLSLRAGLIPSWRSSGKQYEGGKQERHILRFEVTGEVLASFREALAKLRRDAGGPLDDDATLLLMARHVLGGPADDGRASYQVALTVCEACARATQTGLGEALPISAEVAAMASCDAQHLERVHPQSRSDRHGPTKNQGGSNIGSGDDETHVGGEATSSAKVPPTTPFHARESAGERQLTGSRGQRASQTIPPAIRRAVLRRDQHCCQVPGCRHTTFVDVHHLRTREDGGDHQPDNLLTLCGAHHRACHRGELLIEKSASGGLSVWHADGTAYGGRPSTGEADVAARTFRGLRNLGFGEQEARTAVREAGAHVGRDSGVEGLMRAALEQLTRNGWEKAS